MVKGSLWKPPRDVLVTQTLLPHKVVAVHDVTSIYRVPLLLEQQSVLKFLVKRLGIPITTPRTPHYLYKWKNLADRYTEPGKQPGSFEIYDTTWKCQSDLERFRTLSSIYILLASFPGSCVGELGNEANILLNLELMSDVQHESKLSSLSPLPLQIRFSSAGGTDSASRQIHQAGRLLHFRHQGSPTRSPVHQEQVDTAGQHSLSPGLHCPGFFFLHTVKTQNLGIVLLFMMSKLSRVVLTVIVSGPQWSTTQPCSACYFSGRSIPTLLRASLLKGRSAFAI